MNTESKVNFNLLSKSPTTNGKKSLKKKRRNSPTGR